MIRRRYPLTLADYAQAEAALWVDNACGLPCQPAGRALKPGEVKRLRVGKDSPRIARLVAEIDEAEAFRRTYIRPLPKEDE